MECYSPIKRTDTCYNVDEHQNVLSERSQKQKFTYCMIPFIRNIQGLPWWRSGQESTCQCRGHGFEPWSGKIPHAVEQLSPCATTTEPALWSPRATTTEPACHNYWRPCAKSPCSATRQETTMRSPRTAMKSSPRWPQLETARAQQQRPNTANNKNK